MKLSTLSALICSLILFVNFGVMAQSFKYNTNPKGIKLPVQNVLQIEQDTLGMIWMSTTRGVFYSDGIETFPLADSLNTEFDFQITIHKDEDGIIWLYNDRGVANFLKGGYGNWESVNFQGIDSLVNLPRIKFTTRGKGNEKEYFLDVGQRFFYWVEGKAPQEFSKDQAEFGFFTYLGGDSVTPVFFFDKGTLILENGGLRKIEWDLNKVSSVPVISKQSPETGEFYFLGEDYLAKGPDQFTPKEIIDQGIKENFKFLDDYYGLEFSKGSVFYHFNSDLFKLSYGSRRPMAIDLEHTFRVFYIQDFFIDREGILWVGTARGLANLNSLSFQNYDVVQSGLMSQEVTAIAAVKGDEYLFGYNNGIQKISRYDIQDIYVDSKESIIPNSRIINFSRERDRAIWFSSNIRGVGRYDIAANKVDVYGPPPNVQISSVNVYGDSLLITSPKSVYYASVNDRGDKLFENSIQEELEELMHHRFYYLRKSGKLKDGRTIIMRASRIENTEDLISTPEFLLADGYDFLEMEEGILLGTESGLKLIKGGKVQDYVIGEHEIKRPVFSILRDSGGTIWLGTDDGIFQIENGITHHYNQMNGLANNETNRGALVEGVEGRIMIGTLDGFSIFKPQEKFIAKGTPKVFLKSFSLEGESIIDKDHVRTGSQQNSLELEYSAVGFNEEKELWVHWRLKGFEESWQVLVEPKARRFFYPRLPPGDYQFEIKASYAGENFSPLVTSVEFTVLRPFYMRFWFLALASLVMVAVGYFVKSFFDQGNKLGVLESTVSKKDKEKAAAEKQFKNVWDSSKDPMLLTVNGQKIIAANPTFARYVQTEATLLEGKELIEVFGDSDFLRKYQQEMLTLPEEGKTLKLDFSWNGVNVEMEIYSKKISSEGVEGETILSMFRDVTAERQIEKNLRDAKEKAEEANRFKTSLLSNVSHEIRTPLNVILGGTEHVMMTRKDDSKLLDELDIILQSGERLLATITSILDMAKIEANKMEVVYSKVDFVEFISLVMKPFFAHAQRKGIQLKLDFKKKDVKGETDKRFLEMILNNLVGNSLKYTESGTVKVTVDSQDGALLIKIEDEGVGMSTEFIPKIFQPFEQESTGNQRQFEGTGLGMAITKNLLDLLNGHINLQSAKNQGTRVIVEIPLSNS